MKLIFNGKEVYELTETQKKVILNDIPKEIFDADMLRRCKYWLESPVEKFCNANRKKIEQELKNKGVKEVPIDLCKLLSKHAEIFPPPCGLDDIQAIPCQVGNGSFELSVDHCKGWRKMCEAQQKDKPKEDYLVEEDKMLCDRFIEIIEHKYERCFERLKRDWIPKLEALNILNVPVEEEELANLIFSQLNYKDRSARDEELLILPI